MFLLKDLVVLEPNSSKFKTQCNLWKWKDSWVSHKFFCLVQIEQPLLVAKLTRAEINGFRAGRCVWRPPSRHEILFVPYDVHLHFLLFTCFSCKILSYLNQIHPNSKRRATYEMERIVGGLAQVFLERRDWTASVGCKADTGWDKWLQSWSLCVAAAEPPWNSLCSIWCPSPLPALHMFLLKDLVILEPNSSKFKTQCNLLNGKNCRRSHASFSGASRLNSLCWLQSWHGLR